MIFPGKEETNNMRLDRFLSMNGFASRSGSKKIINQQRVKVNGKVTTVNDLQISGEDKITVDDIPVENLPYVTLIMNKPEGYLCSMIDEKYPSVMNLVPENYRKRVRMVGRLDQDTTGLLILTDNGVLNSRLANPKYEVEKTYAVRVNHVLKMDLIGLFKAGNIDIGRGNIASSSKLTILDDYHAHLTIHEGKYHEVKRLFSRFDYEVVELQRISFGPLTLGDLPLGQTRKVTEEEYLALLEMTNMKKEEQL